MVMRTEKKTSVCHVSKKDVFAAVSPMMNRKE